MTEDLKYLQNNYSRAIPNNFKIVEDAKSYVSVFYFSDIIDGRQYGTINDFSKNLNLSEEEAYHY